MPPTPQSGPTSAHRPQRVIVIGGTGAMASRVTQGCLDAGDHVLVVARGQRPDGALGGRGASGGGTSGASASGGGALSWLRTDRADLADHRAALTDFAPDAVVDAICFGQSHAEQLLDLFAGVRRMVMVSTVDVYGEDVGVAPVTEERPPAPVTPYAVGKLAAERILLDGLGAGATIVRPSHMLGRGFLTAGLWGRTEHVVARLRAGLPVLVLDGGRGLITPVHAGDVAAWIRASLTTAAADGQVFNAVGAATVTMRDYLEAIAAHLGVAARLVPVSSSVVRASLDVPVQFAFHRPYSNAKAERLLGHRAGATLESMLAETIDAMPVRVLGVGGAGAGGVGGVGGAGAGGAGEGELPPSLVAASRAEDALIAVLERQARELGEVLVETDPRG